MQHFTTLGNAAYKFFKTFRANHRKILDIPILGKKW